jgi:WD40 repeat protein
MLQDLPVEIVEQIIGHLPTASAIVNLGQTNHKFNSIVSAPDHKVFRTLVERNFPTINTPPFWKEVARALTSRSRAWDRRAFIARECYPPPDDPDQLHEPRPAHTLGYQPTIDSYETWLNGSWSDRKEVLAFGAAGRLRVRTIKDGTTTWRSYRTPGDDEQRLDILDVRILRPHQAEDPKVDTFIFERADSQITKVEISEQGAFSQETRYDVPAGEFSYMDVSKSPTPLLTICGNHGLSVFPVHGSKRLVKPASSAPLAEKYGSRTRVRCVKFLSDTTVAITNQLLRGPYRGQIQIYDISPSGLSSSPVAELASYSLTSPVLGVRHNANVVVPLDESSSSPTQHDPLFLSGWTDGIARLYDTRVPRDAVAQYVDTVDDGQILSLLPIGQERFMAGSSQNGCLKLFDLRITGAKTYSYLDARPSSTISPASEEQKDVNIFITPSVKYGERLWEPLPRNPGKRASGYRGSVYSLSSPSPSSPTVYAGITNHVLQLDFVSTDDIRHGRIKPPILDTSAYPTEDKTRASEQHILNLSCYERPREGMESTDPVLLRKQLDLAWTLRHGAHDFGAGTVEAGWDERMRLNTSLRDGGMGSGTTSASSGGNWRTQRRQPT